MEHKTKINAKEGKQDLVITREFNLSVELLYKAYTESQFIEQWMGTKVIKLENKYHGSYQFETSDKGKVVFSAHGTIHEVLPNQRIVCTFEIINMSMGVQLEFLDFEKLTSDTSKLTIHIIYKTEKNRAEQLKLPFKYGLNMAHDRLEEILNNLQ